MKNKILSFLKEQCSPKPKEIDKLITSAFLTINNFVVKQNLLLKDYCIQADDGANYKKLQAFVSIFKEEQTKFDFEKLIQLFEFVISPSDRVVTGAIYTPANIRRYIVSSTFSHRSKELSHVLVADIACGCGGFLFDAARDLRIRTNATYAEIFKRQIYGIDIQGYSITRTKLLLSLLAISEGEDKKQFDFNLFVGDSLEFDWKSVLKSFSGFDIILGNPPYVCARNLDDKTKRSLEEFEVCRAGNPDLYIPFFQIGFENLSSNGILGYITMNSFFKSLNGRELRRYFKERKVSLKVIDFGGEQIFKSKNTYTCICFIENTISNVISYTATSSKALDCLSYKAISYDALDSFKGWNLKDNEIITRIESTGKSLGDLFKMRQGIATLKNDIYIFRPIAEDKNFYYLQNGSIYPIEKKICRDIVNSNKLSREVKIRDLIEKVIFPYSSSEKPKLFDEGYLKVNFPYAFKYLKAKKEILNQRDKGKGEYENWFAFGRTQSLEKMKNKLFFPKYSDKTPCYLMNSDDSLMFYNGLALIGNSGTELAIIKKILESNIFWYYVKTTSKPYSSGYYSLNGNYIKNFGVCDLSKDEKAYVLNETDKGRLDKFLEKKYGIVL